MNAFRPSRRRPRPPELVTQLSACPSARARISTRHLLVDEVSTPNPGVPQMALKAHFDWKQFFLKRGELVIGSGRFHLPDGS